MLGEELSNKSKLLSDEILHILKGHNYLVVKEAIRLLDYKIKNASTVG